MVLMLKYSDTLKKKSRDENRKRRNWQWDRKWQHEHSHITLHYAFLLQFFSQIFLTYEQPTSAVEIKTVVKDCGGETGGKKTTGET